MAAVLGLLGGPLFVVLATLALVQFYLAEVDLTVISIEMYRIAQTPTLSAIPLFAFAGFVLAASDAPHRLVHLSQVAFGWRPGGLAIMGLVVYGPFTALTGASGTTILALGGLPYPAMLQQRYPEDFSLGLLTTSGHPRTPLLTQPAAHRVRHRLGSPGGPPRAGWHHPGHLDGDRAGAPCLSQGT